MPTTEGNPVEGRAASRDRSPPPVPASTISHLHTTQSVSTQDAATQTISDEAVIPHSATSAPVPLTYDEDQEFDDFNDEDSAYGETAGYSETSSLASSILKYRIEAGRTYHAYGSTQYWGPNDEEAKDQQDLSHHFWTLVLEGKFYNAPIKNPQKIFDVGTGTGIWAIDVADATPGAEVKAIDVSPIQPTWAPPNVKFEIDDYNQDWLYENRFDLIHTREILGTVPNWPDFFRKAYKALEPGGWFDCAEPDIFLRGYFHQLAADHPVVQWPAFFTVVGERTGMTFNVGPYLKKWAEDAGFVNVVERKVVVPIGRWPTDKSQKEIGLWNQMRLDLGFRDFTPRGLRHALGWQEEEITVFTAKVRASVRDTRQCLCMDLYFVYGQKPESTAAN